jgi:hypothetical protein
MTVRQINLETGEESTRDYTQEELDAIASIPQPDPKDAIREQIKQLEAKQLEAKQLMPRATREFMLTFMEMNAPAEVLAVNPGYQAVKAFDLQIKALRDQL